MLKLTDAEVLVLTNWEICPGGRLHGILPRMCRLKLEGNGSFLVLEGGKRSPAIWVYFRGFTPVWVCL